MQSALVRKDPVMLHDPMRTHGRATTVGVVLGALGCLGFLVFGIFKPAPSVPDSGIVISEQSGQVYVVNQGGDQLIPTFNVASAKLLSMAQAQESSEGGAAPQPPEGDGLEPQVVPDEQLTDISRARLRGIPDGPPLLPSQDQTIRSQWAVCDALDYDDSLPPETARQEATVKSQVLAGVSAGEAKDELPQNQAILAQNGAETYLIYRQQNTQAGPGNAVKALVDLSPDDPVTSAFGLDPQQARKVSPSLLEAIPNATGQLVAPQIDGAQESPNYDIGPASPQVGSIINVVDAGAETLYVVLKDGIQEVSEGAANVILASNQSGTSETPRDVSLADISNAPKLGVNDPRRIETEHFPSEGIEIVDQQLSPHTCLGWKVQGEGAARDSFTTVYVHRTSPLPNGAKPIDVGTAAPDGYNKVDQFYMQPGYAAPVRSATSKETFGKGPLQLISDRGIRYGIPNVTTAQWLGLGENLFQPAPETIIKMLPAGASLNPQDVRKTYDSVQVAPNAPEGGAAAPGG